jgi:hypothetical protein
MKYLYFSPKQTRNVISFRIAGSRESGIIVMMTKLTRMQLIIFWFRWRKKNVKHYLKLFFAKEQRTNLSFCATSKLGCERMISANKLLNLFIIIKKKTKRKIKHLDILTLKSIKLNQSQSLPSNQITLIFEINHKQIQSIKSIISKPIISNQLT